MTVIRVRFARTGAHCPNLQTQKLNHTRGRFPGNATRLIGGLPDGSRSTPMWPQHRLSKGLLLVRDQRTLL
jgi:hypothetical protein